MALHWDLTNCKLDKEWQKNNWNAIESMIWLTMVIDCGEITSDNLEMVEYRLRCYSKVTGQEIASILDILPKLVGLTTNVHTTKPNEFGKRIMLMLDYEVKLNMTWAKAAKKEADAVS